MRGRTGAFPVVIETVMRFEALCVLSEEFCLAVRVDKRTWRSIFMAPLGTNSEQFVPVVSMLRTVILAGVPVLDRCSKLSRSTSRVDA